MTTQQWPDEPLPPSPPGQPSTLGQQVAHAKAEAATRPDSVRASAGLPPEQPTETDALLAVANDVAKLTKYRRTTRGKTLGPEEDFYAVADIEALFATLGTGPTKEPK